MIQPSAAKRSSMSSVRAPRSCGRAAAEDELLRLDEELDFANAAAPELDVVAGDRDLAMAAHGVDLPLHRMDVGDRGIVEIFAPDERRELGEKASPSSRSPATGRALIIAARSQFWPSVS